MIGLLLLALFTICFTMVARRLSSTILTAPMLFIGFGYLLSTTGVMPQAGAESMLHIVAEVALIVLLFLDAAQTDLATALFALLIIPKNDGELAEPILFIAVNTVWISALLHGLSAAPGQSSTRALWPIQIRLQTSTKS